MSTSRYPDSWPKPRAKEPETVQSRVTEQQKIDLYNRSITTRALAATLGCSETYLSSLFPGKVPLRDRKLLIATRKAYKLEIAMDILRGKYSIRSAAEVACTSYNTMCRNLALAKEQNPALAESYVELLKSQRAQTIAATRRLRKETSGNGYTPNGHLNLNPGAVRLSDESNV